MSDPASKPAPFSLRLTPEERARLVREAGSLSLATYIRSRLFDPAVIPPRRRVKAPVQDHRALAQVLALLGQSRIPNNLNQVAKAANLGALMDDPALEADLREALEHIAAIRRMLIAALGLSEGSP